MDTNSKFVIKRNEVLQTVETLHINRSKKSVRGSFRGFSFIDDDTKSQIFYVPSLDISGYGPTIDDAQKMVFDSTDDLFKSLLNMTPNEIQDVLKEMGWEKNRIFNKQFSKVSVDAKGQLQGFNIQKNSLQTVDLIAA